ncbi:hypothetical protein GCM10029976_079580 [Kribbella albertanoniae]
MFPEPGWGGWAPARGDVGGSAPPRVNPLCGSVREWEGRAAGKGLPAARCGQSAQWVRSGWGGRARVGLLGVGRAGAGGFARREEGERDGVHSAQGGGARVGSLGAGAGEGSAGWVQWVGTVGSVGGCGSGWAPTR